MKFIDSIAGSLMICSVKLNCSKTASSPQVSSGRRSLKSGQLEKRTVSSDGHGGVVEQNSWNLTGTLDEDRGSY